VGSACLTIESLRRWFTAEEYGRLIGLGYRCVRLDGCRVLYRGEAEVVIARARQFRKGAVPVSLYGAEGAGR
jgi:hypothetical protein